MLVERRIRRNFADDAQAFAYARHLDDAIKQADAALLLGHQPTATLLEIIEPFLRSRMATNRAYSQQRAQAYRRVLRRFANDLGGKAGDLPIDRIFVADVEEWVQARYKESGRSGRVQQGTVKGEVDMLRAAIRWAASRQEFCAPGRVVPILGIEPLSAGSPRQPKCLPIPMLHTAIAKIDAINPHVGVLLWAMELTGARGGALVKVRWSDMRRPTEDIPGEVRIPAIKHGPPLVRKMLFGDPLHQVFARAYKQWNETHGKYARRKHHPIFCTKKSYGYSTSSFSRSAADAAKRAGLKDFTPYVVRHSIMTALKEQGIDSSYIRHYAAHTNENTQAVYDHTTNTNAAGALGIINQWVADFTVDKGSRVRARESGATHCKTQHETQIDDKLHK